MSTINFVKLEFYSFDVQRVFLENFRTTLKRREGGISVVSFSGFHFHFSFKDE